MGKKRTGSKVFPLMTVSVGTRQWLRETVRTFRLISDFGGLDQKQLPSCIHVSLWLLPSAFSDCSEPTFRIEDTCWNMLFQKIHGVLICFNHFFIFFFGGVVLFKIKNTVSNIQVCFHQKKSFGTWRCRDQVKAPQCWSGDKLATFFGWLF